MAKQTITPAHQQLGPLAVLAVFNFLFAWVGVIKLLSLLSTVTVVNPSVPYRRIAIAVAGVALFLGAGIAYLNEKKVARLLGSACSAVSLLVVAGNVLRLRAGFPVELAIDAGYAVLVLILIHAPSPLRDRLVRT